MLLRQVIVKWTIFGLSLSLYLAKKFSCVTERKNLRCVSSDPFNWWWIVIEYYAEVGSDLLLCFEIHSDSSNSNTNVHCPISSIRFGFRKSNELILNAYLLKRFHWNSFILFLISVVLVFQRSYASLQLFSIQYLLQKLLGQCWNWFSCLWE